MRKRCQARVTNSTMQSDRVLCRYTFTRNELNRNEDACKDIAKEDAQGLLTTKSIQVKQRTIQKCDKDCCLGTDTRIRRRALQPYSYRNGRHFGLTGNNYLINIPIQQPLLLMLSTSALFTQSASLIFMPHTNLILHER